MTNEDRSPKEIEREIEEQRSELTSNIEDLQDKFSIDTLVRQVGDHFREHGGDLSRSVLAQAKANPIPLALTGIGLAWLMASGSAQQRETLESENFKSDRMVGDGSFGHIASGRSNLPALNRRSSYDDSPSWVRTEDNFHDDDGDLDGYDMTDRDTDNAKGAKESVASAAASVRDGVSSTASGVSDRAAMARDRIYEGTETLSEEGRKRVLAARRKAVQLRSDAGTSARQGADAAQDFFDNQPLVAGALAMAVGAAIGGALPRTDAEDDFMGRQSDDLIAEAERIFDEEKGKAMNVAEAVGDEVTIIAGEAKDDLDSGAPGDQSAVEALGSKAKTAAKRVADKASAEANKQNLGKPKT